MNTDRTDYNNLCAQAESLIRDVPHLTANLANISALVFHSLPEINWAGFYITGDGVLVLGPFQGKPACIEIPFGKGVCGTAAERNGTLLVADVHEFPGHIACDSDSNSEIVIPIRRGGAVWGVLDIDSPLPGRFSDADRTGLEELVRTIERCLFPREGKAEE